MNISPGDIDTFLEVVRAHSVSRAAQNLGVGQPAVSKAIARLEGQIGVVLFQRGVQGSRLTNDGQLFVEAARRFHQKHFEMLRLATDLRARNSGLLRVGITSPSAEGLEVRAISELVRRRPGMRLQLRVDKSDSLNAAVEDGDLDLAVVPCYPGQAWSCTQLDLSKDHIRVAVRAGHALCRAESLSLSNLEPYKWVMASRQSAATQALLRIFERSGAPQPQVAVEVDYMSEAAMGILCSTDLISLIPGSVLTGWLGRVMPLAIPQLDIGRNKVLLSRPQADWSPLMNDLRDLMLSHRLVRQTF